MTTFLSRYPRLTLTTLIVVVALSIWIPRQLKLLQTRGQLFELQKQLAATGPLSATAEELEKSRNELAAENSRRSQAVSDLSKAQHALDEKYPDARWTTPPTSLPDWNPESPFIWLRKEMVPRFPVQAFTDTGELQAEIPYVMTIDAGTTRALNEKLKRLLAEYRALEVAKAERTEEHLPGIAGEKGDKLTIRVSSLPVEGAQIRQQFESALTDALGEQRATLLQQVSSTWLDIQFARFGTEPKTISLLRRPGGDFNISIKTAGGNWSSMGGPARIVKHQIPPHFLPLFAPLLDMKDPAVAKGE